ncbi:uncharacterized protein LOC142317714 [Lycorma delicatula]|uniref:uncharacterized protein LOC142317714 n=1 Tax=Lycorma delicatula TaxID=130591 RepID=UPI003F51A2BF
MNLTSLKEEPVIVSFSESNDVHFIPALGENRESRSESETDSPGVAESGYDDSSARRRKGGKNDIKLHEAVLKDDAEAVRRILKEYPVNVNSRNNFGRTCLHWAASFNNIDIMETLIAARCDLEAQDKSGMRPLMMAAWHGHLKAVRLLINCGASVLARDKKQQTLLMCATKNIRVVKFLLDTLENIDLEATDIEEKTALHHASQGGHLQTVTKLVQFKADTKNRDKRGRTPLHLACEQGHTSVAEFLIKHESDLEARDIEGNSPLHLAVENKQNMMVSLLLEAGTPVDIENNKGQTPLHMASSRGCRNTIESLLQHGCDLNKQCNNGSTPLHMAVELNDSATVELLISRGANFNALNKRRQSPIHIAAECGYTDICKILLNAGANIAQKEQGGRTPLYIAARGSFTAIVDMIIKTARLDYPEPEEGSTGINNAALNTTRRRRRLKHDDSTARSNDFKLKKLLWKLAYKKLDNGDWKKLALHWAFTDDQIKAIEHQYTGRDSYKEHCHRMLWIWCEGLEPEVEPLKELSESLDAIEKKKVADGLTARSQKGLSGDQAGWGTGLPQPIHFFMESFMQKI